MNTASEHDTQARVTGTHNVRETTRTRLENISKWTTILYCDDQAAHTRKKQKKKNPTHKSRRVGGCSFEACLRFHVQWKSCQANPSNSAATNGGHGRGTHTHTRANGAAQRKTRKSLSLGLFGVLVRWRRPFMRPRQTHTQKNAMRSFSATLTINSEIHTHY